MDIPPEEALFLPIQTTLTPEKRPRNARLHSHGLRVPRHAARTSSVRAGNAA
jgi:hypothetical protein